MIGDPVQAPLPKSCNGGAMQETRNMAGFDRAIRRSSMHSALAMSDETPEHHRWWNRAGRALFCSLHDSRKRVAERVIREHRHLIGHDADPFGTD